MAIFDSHAALSGGLGAVVVASLGAPHAAVIVAAVACAYWGAEADVDPLIAGLKDFRFFYQIFRSRKYGILRSAYFALYKGYDWSLYNKLHLDPPWYIRYNPFAALHPWIDRYFHKGNPDWWHDKWWADVLMRLAGWAMIMLSATHG